jgi:hypothetical protein
MAEAAEALDFERAAMLRDRLRAATFIQGSQAINAEGLDNADIFALAARAGRWRAGLLHPRRAELGPPRLLPHAHRGRGRGSAAKLPDPVLRGSAARRAVSWSTANCPRRAAGEALSEAGGKVEISVPQRGDRRRLMAQASATRSRRSSGGWPSAAPRRRPCASWPSSSNCRSAAADRGLRQQPHPGRQGGRRDGGGRAGRFPQEPVPQVQHPRRADQRRFRHDARGDGPSLRAGCWRRRPGEETRRAAPGRIWC